MVEEVSEVEKRAQVRVLGFILDASEEDRREVVDHLWSDPDRRYEFYEKCNAKLEESAIHREIMPGVRAELRDALEGARGETEDEAFEIAMPRMKSLMVDAGVYEEFGGAATEARISAFIEYVLDYLEIPHN